MAALYRQFQIIEGDARQLTQAWSCLYSFQEGRNSEMAAVSLSGTAIAALHHRVIKSMLKVHKARYEAEMPNILALAHATLRMFRSTALGDRLKCNETLRGAIPSPPLLTPTEHGMFYNHHFLVLLGVASYSLAIKQRPGCEVLAIAALAVVETCPCYTCQSSLLQKNVEGVRAISPMLMRIKKTVGDVEHLILHVLHYAPPLTTVVDAVRPFVARRHLLICEKGDTVCTCASRVGYVEDIVVGEVISWESVRMLPSLLRCDMLGTIVHFDNTCTKLRLAFLSCTRTPKTEQAHAALSFAEYFKSHLPTAPGDNDSALTLLRRFDKNILKIILEFALLTKAEINSTISVQDEDLLIDHWAYRGDPAEKTKSFLRQMGVSSRQHSTPRKRKTPNRGAVALSTSRASNPHGKEICKREDSPVSVTRKQCTSSAIPKSAKRAATVKITMK